MLTCKTHDNAIRWSEGERLDHLFERRCDELDAAFDDTRMAVVTENASYSYRDLDNRANQVARYLTDRGIKSGDRVGLLFDKSVETYIALLAVLKVNAAYVPFDCSFPNDRIAFILEDADVKAVLSLSGFKEKADALAIPRIYLDEAAGAIDAQPASRLTAAEKGTPGDDLAYIIYTSGTTGRPKGVAIEHASICNFVRVAAVVYGYVPEDRVFQGMTIAFDFSVEELWVPLIAGATLIPAKPGFKMVGSELADFLLEHKVTAMCCVPTLLATIERDLPDMRLLLVSGEACPQDLVSRWHRPGRTILNAYGPTEATVTATLTELVPDKAVTIGGPLPTYTIVILDEHEDAVVEEGGMGEVGIAGIGLARGYLNRADLTQEKFVPDFVGIENNPSGRIYRTGDLGRINADGEIEFHGRIDTQVKIRGYRIELGEIEAVLLQAPGIGQAVVDTFEPEPGAVELVAYYTLAQGAAGLDESAIGDLLRANLPAYMVPAYLEELPIIPMTLSDKADRKNLPPPKGPRFTVQSADHVAPTTETERVVADTLAQVLQVERVSIEDDFFLDLGAHSLLMARFGSELRKALAGADVSMREIYQNATVAKLSAILDARVQDRPTVKNDTPCRVATDLEYYGTGALQILFLVAYGVLGLAVLVVGFEWTYAAVERPLDLYLRIVAFFIGGFTLFTAIPIAAKWLLIGRWRAQTIPIWSLRYLRFWVVKTLIASAPISLFAGSPIYNVYLRLLGAKIGRNTVIKSASFPVCTDLISIGDDTILNRGSHVTGYRAQANFIHIGPVSIGHRVFVGEAGMLDMGTVMENDSELGHASSLHEGQRVPRERRYHGSPGEETQTRFCQVGHQTCSPLRRAVYSLCQLVPIFGVAGPLAVLILYHGFPYIYHGTSASELDLSAPEPTLPALALETLLISLAAFPALLLLGLAVVGLAPRLLNRFLQEDRTYVLYGVHYYIFGILSGISNSKFFNELFGDSSYIVRYLRWVGYTLNKVVQTGANFGLEQKHDNPFLCDIGTGTMISDGLLMANLQMSNTSFRLGKVRIGERNYFGNNILYPAAGKTGANCLLGTKVMVPIDGPVRENVGLLGSPTFEIPRAVKRDQAYVASMDESVRQQALRKKNIYNLKTMAVFLLSLWAFGAVSLFAGFVAVLFYPDFGILSLLAGSAFVSVFGILYFAFCERASLRFRRLEPRTVSMYDPYYWFHERHWKFSTPDLMSLFKGTPLKNAISRLLGVRVGRKVFDDGANMPDKTLLEIGDYATLNAGSVLQGHSLEEGVFKSDRIRIGAGCTLAPGAFVHYGVTMGSDVILGPDSFLMKGEVLDANTIWRGNPARAVREAARPEKAAAISLTSAADAPISAPSKVAAAEKGLAGVTAGIVAGERADALHTDRLA